MNPHGLRDPRCRPLLSTRNPIRFVTKRQHQRRPRRSLGSTISRIRLATSMVTPLPEPVMSFTFVAGCASPEYSPPARARAKNLCGQRQAKGMRPAVASCV